MTFQRKIKSSLMGFNKKDTMKCIQDISNEYNSMLLDAQQENSSLQSQVVELQQKLSEHNTSAKDFEQYKIDFEKKLDQKVKEAEETRKKFDFVTNVVREKISLEVNYRNQINTLKQYLQTVDEKLQNELSKKSPNQVIEEMSQKVLTLSEEVQLLKERYINAANLTVKDIDDLNHKLLYARLYLEEMKLPNQIGQAESFSSNKTDNEQPSEGSTFDRLFKMMNPDQNKGAK